MLTGFGVSAVTEASCGWVNSIEEIDLVASCGASLFFAFEIPRRDREVDTLGVLEVDSVVLVNLPERFLSQADLVKIELSSAGLTFCVVKGQPRIIRTFILAFCDLDPVDPGFWVCFNCEGSLEEGHGGAWE